MVREGQIPPMCGKAIPQQKGEHMVIKGKVGIANQEVTVTCPACGGQQRELLVDIEHSKEALCQDCGCRFKVRL